MEFPTDLCPFLFKPSLCNTPALPHVSYGAPARQEPASTVAGCDWCACGLGCQLLPDDTQSVGLDHFSVSGSTNLGLSFTWLWASSEPVGIQVILGSFTFG